MNLSNYLDAHRIRHSVAVSQKAVELAHVYNLDSEICRIAGLLHDIGKDVVVPEGADKILFHCVAGVEIAKNDFNIRDERILNSILYHTTGHPDMDDYAKVIFIADKTEKNRTYEDVTYLRSLTGQPLDLIVQEVIESSRKYHEHLHPWTIELLNKWGIQK